MPPRGSPSSLEVSPRSAPLRCALLVAGLGLLLPGLGVAEAAPAVAWMQPTKADLARAESLYQEGDKLEQGNDEEGALAKFKEALAIIETPQLRLRAGRCHERLGRFASASAEYQRALELATGDAQLTKLAEQQLDGVRDQVPTVTLSFAQGAPPEGTSARADGASFSIQKSLPLDPGHHVVEVDAPGYRGFRQEIDLTPGARLTIEVALALVAAKGDGGDAASPVPWILIGAGAAFAIPAVAFGVATVFIRDELATDYACTERSFTQLECAVTDPTRQGEVRDLIDRVHLFYGLAAGSAVVSAALLASGVGLAVAGAGATTTSVAPQWGPSQAGVLVRGTFH